MDGPPAMRIEAAALLSVEELLVKRTPGSHKFHIVVRTSIAARAEINIASESYAVCHRWAAALRAAIVPVTFDGWLRMKKGERANSGWRCVPSIVPHLCPPRPDLAPVVVLAARSCSKEGGCGRLCGGDQVVVMVVADGNRKILPLLA